MKFYRLLPLVTTMSKKYALSFTFSASTRKGEVVLFPLLQITVRVTKKTIQLQCEICKLVLDIQTDNNEQATNFYSYKCLGRTVNVHWPDKISNRHMDKN